MSSQADNNKTGGHTAHGNSDSSKGNLNNEESAGAEGTESEEDEL
jgi:hypothetical protein